MGRRWSAAKADVVGVCRPRSAIFTRTTVTGVGASLVGALPGQRGTWAPTRDAPTPNRGRGSCLRRNDRPKRCEVPACAGTTAQGAGMTDAIFTRTTELSPLSIAHHASKGEGSRNEVPASAGTTELCLLRIAHHASKGEGSPNEVPASAGTTELCPLSIALHASKGEGSPNEVPASAGTTEGLSGASLQPSRASPSPWTRRTSAGRGARHPAGRPTRRVSSRRLPPAWLAPPCCQLPA